MDVGGQGGEEFAESLLRKFEILEKKVRKMLDEEKKRKREAGGGKRQKYKEEVDNSRSWNQSITRSHCRNYASPRGKEQQDIDTIW